MGIPAKRQTLADGACCCVAALPHGIPAKREKKRERKLNRKAKKKRENLTCGWKNYGKSSAVLMLSAHTDIGLPALGKLAKQGPNPQNRSTEPCL